MPGINTTGFPGFAKATYTDVRAYFDAVKPWRSKYNPDGDERPIGIRAVHHDDGQQFNKAMRMLSDESIAFRLFNTDCVVWHPDGTLTIHGWPSVSTNAFISTLTPAGIYQSCRHQMYNGRRGDAFDPVLRLMPIAKHKSSWGDYDGPDWRGGIVIHCEREVRLNYSAKAGHWVPAEPDRLQPFYVPTIDRRAAREVSKQYHLATLKKVVNAIMALNAPPPPPAGETSMGGIMAALEREEYMEAIALFPRGQSDSFGKVHGTLTGIKPGFLRQLRDHIYDHEGVVTREERRTLTPAQYKRYVADSNRFD